MTLTELGALLMRTITPCLRLAGLVAVFALHGVDTSAQVPAEAEARLRAIYERGEFNARAEHALCWLPCHSWFLSARQILWRSKPMPCHQTVVGCFFAQAGTRLVAPPTTIGPWSRLQGRFGE
jgi:hypothetical protein